MKHILKGNDKGDQLFLDINLFWFIILNGLSETLSLKSLRSEI